MNGIIYCRVSSKEQIEGTSLDSQEIACREAARTRKVAVLRVFIGRGESAKFADRPELLELLEYCRQHKGRIQYLFIWKIDRLARNVSDFFSLKALLLKYGIEVVSVTEPIDSNPEGKLLETILVGFAQFDNDIRAMRTVQGMKRKLQEGIFPWHPPLGYKCAGFKQHGLKKTKPDSPDEPLFSLLQKAWNEFATGAHTKAEIRRLMAHWGIRTREGKPLPPQSVDNLFRNKYYAGIVVDPWSGDEHTGQHTPMVSREVFARVQGVISRRNRSIPHQKQSSEFPLRGFVRCPGCQGYLTGGFSRGRSQRYGYYQCGNKRCIMRRNHPIGKIHAEFKGFLASLGIGPEHLEELQKQILAKAEEERALDRDRQEKRDAELQGLNKQLQQLINMRSTELLTDEEFRAQKELLAQRKLALETIARQEATDPGQIRDNIRQIIKPLANLGHAWDRFRPSARVRFNRMMFPVGFVTGQIRTAERARLFSLNGHLADKNSMGVALRGEFLNHLMQEIQAFAALFRGEEQNDLPA